MENSTFKETQIHYLRDAKIINMKKAYVFPGQGSQFSGMGKDLYETNPLAKELFEKANSILGFRITDTMELIAHLQIPQSELSKFAAGNAASIEVASMPDKGFTATIARISPTINTRNGTFRATALISNAEGNLAPGMFGHFTIAYEQHTDALVIPAEALIDEDDENTVYVVNDGEVVRRNVEIGIAADGNIEILDGLNEDDVVVVVGHSGLRNGSKVLASNTTPDSFTG